MTQTISRDTQGEGSPYFGKRALLLTRVSTPKQIEMYGHAWQEMQIRKLLIEPLGLLLDEERHIIEIPTQAWSIAIVKHSILS